jgi:phosphatidate cytidylyltransferase
MNNFWQRALTGTVFVGVIVGLTLWNQYAFLALLAIITLGGLYEFYKIVFEGRLKWIHYVFMAIGVAVLAIRVYGITGYLYIFAFIFAISAIYVLLSKERKWKHIGYLISGILYISLPLLLFLTQVSGYHDWYCIGREAYNPLLALNLFVLIWSSDTFAYITGRAFGKHKLFESVSPGKTWEGFIGGTLLTVALSFLLANQWNIPYSVNIAVALCTVIFGTLGDLVESMLKREFNIKDSGKILPGHGGFLDRFDALLISLPFTTFCYYIWRAIL